MLLRPIITIAVASALACAGAACSKKSDEGPQKVTLEQLQASQASTQRLGNEPGYGKSPTQPVGSVDNPSAAQGVGLPVEASARTLAIEAPTLLSPLPDSDEVNTSGAYAGGDKIRFRTRVTGFTLQQGESSFDFEWWIDDATGRRIVSDAKTVVQRFLPEQGYSPVVSHRPAGLAGGRYTIHVKVTDNKAAYLSREAQAEVSYGQAAAANLSGLTLKDLHFSTGSATAQPAGKPISFDFTVLGLLADATRAAKLELEVKLRGGGNERIVPRARHNGTLSPEGTFPLTVNLDGVPAGAYTLMVRVTDLSNEHIGTLEQPLTVQ
ncbi:MAG: hypothetical protein IT370_04015 [Deltaproteobacteria bacterium]|nr:hypothetical protein [Deltaproteobacteria bacterium]